METEPHAATVSSRRSDRRYCQIASYLCLPAKYFDCTEVTEVKFIYLLGRRKKCNFVPVFFIYVMSPLSWRGAIINTNGLTNKEALGCKLHSRIFPGNQLQPSRC